MLRRCFQAPLASTAAATTPAFACPLLSAAARTLVVFSEQSAVLANNAKHLGYKSNVWVEEKDDAWWVGKLTQLKKDQQPAEVRLQRDKEYFNLFDFREGRDLERNLPAVKGVASLQGRLFGAQLQAILERAMKQRQRDGLRSSKFWVSRQDLRMRRNELTFKNGRDATPRPVTATLGVMTKVFNADQYEKPALIATYPISSRRLMPFGKDYSALLQPVADKYGCGLFYSARQATLLGLETLDGAVPVEVPTTQYRRAHNDFETARRKNRLTIFNADQLENSAAVLKELQRFPVDVPTYLVSGKPLGSGMTEMLQAAGLLGGRFKSNYFLNEFDRNIRKWTVKPGEAPFVPKDISNNSSNSSSNVEKWFNAKQFKNVEAAFQRAGTIPFDNKSTKSEGANKEDE